jgi:hypothetical protein
MGTGGTFIVVCFLVSPPRRAQLEAANERVIQGEIDVQCPVAESVAKDLLAEFQRQHLEETVVCYYSIRCGHGDVGPLVAAGDWDRRWWRTTAITVIVCGVFLVRFKSVLEPLL